MKILLTLFVLLFSCSVLANSCENWSKLEFRPLEVRDEFKDYNLGVNYIEADAILDTLTDVLVTNFRHFYLSPFFHMGDWEENPENRWGLNYQVCFLTKSMDINEDGKEEILVYVGLTGNRNDVHYILQDDEYIGWKKIMEGAIIYIQDTKTNNYFDLQLYTGLQYSKCSHNGEEYICKDE